MDDVYDPNYDSDEFGLEDVEAPIPFFDVGKKTSAEMLKFAMDDRAAAKSTMANLRDVAGARSGVRSRQLWFNYFTTFMVEVMGRSMTTTPDGELVLRFIAHIVRRLKSNILGKPAYSRNSLKNGILKLVQRLVWKYPDFSLNSNQTRRMDSLYATLVQEGHLMIGRWRKSEWIGFLTLRNLLMAYVSKSLLDGVRSWDCIINRWLSIVLQSCADSRMGEIIRTSGYSGNEYLIWQDVELVLVAGDSFENLQAQVTLRWEKGSKDDPKETRKVIWKPLEHAANMVIDPIVIILVHAMRTGQVPCNTLEGVLDLCRRDRRKRLVWAKPLLPVISAITNGGKGLLLSNPAGASQLLVSIKAAADAGAVLEPVRTHDLRRGSAKDLAKVEQVNAGVSSHVAAALGHSRNALQRGTTDKYADRVSYFLPNAKEKHAMEVQKEIMDPFGLTVLPKPYVKPTLKPHAVTAYMKHNPGLSRTTAGVRLHGELKRAWIQSQEAELQQPTSSSPLPSTILSEKSPNVQSAMAQSMHKRQKIQSALADPNSKRHATTEPLPSFLDPRLLQSEPLDDVQSMFVESNDAPVPPRPNYDDSYDLDDPEELLEADAVAANKVIGILHHGTKTYVDEEAEAYYSDEWDGCEDDEDMDDLLATAVSCVELENADASLGTAHGFVDFFARINLVRFNDREVSTEELIALGYATGNSREPPTRFIHTCQYADGGCPFSTGCKARIDDHHQHSCLYRPDATEAQLARRDNPRDWKCTLCPATFTQQKYLKHHVRAVHPQPLESGDPSLWQPIICQKGCTSGYVYKSEFRYQQHIYKYHAINPKWVPRGCPLKDVCKSACVFDTSASHDRHLRTIHGIDAAERRQIAPDLRTEATKLFATQTCPVRHCAKTRTKFNDRAGLIRHLTTVHHASMLHARHLASYDDEVSEDDLEAISAMIAEAARQDATIVGPVCPVANCSNRDRKWSSRKTFGDHLRRKHGLSPEECARLKALHMPSTVMPPLATTAASN